MILQNNIIDPELVKSSINFTELDKFKKYVIKNKWSRERIKAYLRRYVIKCFKNTLKTALKGKQVSSFGKYHYKKFMLKKGQMIYSNIINYLITEKILFTDEYYTPLYQYNFEISKEMAKAVSSCSCNT